MKKLSLLLILSLVIFACKKEDMSKYATKEELQNSKAEVHNFSLTFDETTNYAFSPTIYKDNPEDVVLTFIHWDNIGGDKTWVQCPITIGSLSIIPEFTNYSLIVNMLNSDGTSGSPFAQSVTYNFKAVVVPLSGINQNPNIDLSNYKEVVETFNLK